MFRYFEVIHNNRHFTHVFRKFTGLYNENGLVYPEFKDNFKRIVPLILGYHFTALYKDVQFINDKLKEHYFPNGTSIEENPQKTVDVSDFIIKFSYFEFSFLKVFLFSDVNRRYILKGNY